MINSEPIFLITRTPARERWRAARGCGGGVWIPVLGVHCVVDVADDLPQQTAALRKEVPRRAGLDAGFAVPQRPGPIPDPVDERRFPQGSGAGKIGEARGVTGSFRETIMTLAWLTISLLRETVTKDKFSCISVIDILLDMCDV